MTQRRAFPRRIDALPALVEFTTAALAPARLDAARSHAVHFTLEELFTNMVKYAPGGAPRIEVEVAIEVGTAGSRVEVALVDTGVDRFDPTRAAEARVDDPIERREPGGLGLHVLKRLVDAIAYDYDPARRMGVTRFRVGAMPVPEPQRNEDDDADH